MGDMQWLFSQVKGPVDDLITEGIVIHMHLDIHLFIEP